MQPNKIATKLNRSKRVPVFIREGFQSNPTLPFESQALLASLRFRRSRCNEPHRWSRTIVANAAVSFRLYGKPRQQLPHRRCLDPYFLPGLFSTAQHERRVKNIPAGKYHRDANSFAVLSLHGAALRVVAPPYFRDGI